MQVRLERVLCPVDFSDSSRRALAHAAAIARRYDAHVTALHVVPLVSAAVLPPEAAATPATPALPDRDTVLDQLDGFVAQCAGVERFVTRQVETGPVVATIVDAARRERADLVVLGTRGHASVGRRLLGSVAERVLRKAPCPVLSVPPHAGDTAEAHAVFTRIVCAIDFSEASLAGLEYAFVLARTSDATVTLLHALENLADLPLAPWSFGVPEHGQALQDEALVKLGRLVPADASDWCRVRIAVADSTPGPEIVRVAHESAADLIVMGIHGRSRVDVLLFGSTTDHVVRNATCPVLSVRPQAL